MVIWILRTPAALFLVGLIISHFFFLSGFGSSSLGDLLPLPVCLLPSSLPSTLRSLFVIFLILCLLFVCLAGAACANCRARERATLDIEFQQAASIVAEQSF